MGSITLTSPVAGTVIAAGLHATNYAALQTLLNGNIDAVNIADGSIGQAEMAAGNKITQSALSGGPPASPTTGDMWIATGVEGANTISWMFRYNSSQATYKWEFVGGPSMSHEVATSELVNNAGYVDAGTVGPTITLARAGEYRYTFGLRMYIGGGAPQTINAGLKLGAAAMSANDTISWYFTVNGTYSGGHAKSMVRTAAASDVWKVQYAGTTVQVESRWLHIQPVRII